VDSIWLYLDSIAQALTPSISKEIGHSKKSTQLFSLSELFISTLKSAIKKLINFKRVVLIKRQAVRDDHLQPAIHGKFNQYHPTKVGSQQITTKPENLYLP
jgi:hypothetical protein